LVRSLSQIHQHATNDVTDYGWCAAKIGGRMSLTPFAVDGKRDWVISCNDTNNAFPLKVYIREGE
jgi:hypothetical protein